MTLSQAVAKHAASRGCLVMLHNFIRQGAIIATAANIFVPAFGQTFGFRLECTTTGHASMIYGDAAINNGPPGTTHYLFDFHGDGSATRSIVSPHPQAPALFWWTLERGMFKLVPPPPIPPPPVEKSKDSQLIEIEASTGKFNESAIYYIGNDRIVSSSEGSCRGPVLGQ